MSHCESLGGSECRAVALEPTKPVAHPMSWRARNPEEWDRLMAVGAEERRRDLISRGRAL